MKTFEISPRPPWWVTLAVLLVVAPILGYFDIFAGIFILSWWKYVIITLILTHLTIAGVTIFLHRCQTHRGLTLHGIPSHFFRFWLWLTTGMVTREWVAIHRKHHAKCETVEDPHSPQVYGITAILFGFSKQYVKESRNLETIKRYGTGAPDDWLERHIYTKYNKFGVQIMLFVDIVLFGPFWGIGMWLVQMLWIPFWAAGVINGVGHYWGYRNFPSRNLKTGDEDASTNIIPIGIIVGGEELHNNHHFYPKSAKLSVKWYEFDIGWFYIRILETLGLARVKYIYDKRAL